MATAHATPHAVAFAYSIGSHRTGRGAASSFPSPPVANWSSLLLPHARTGGPDPLSFLFLLFGAATVVGCADGYSMHSADAGPFRKCPCRSPQHHGGKQRAVQRMHRASWEARCCTSHHVARVHGALCMCG